MTQKATKYLTIMRSTVKKEERMMSCRGMYNAMKDRHGHSSFAFLITKAPQPHPRKKSNCRKNKSTSTQVHPSSFGATIDFHAFFISRFSKNHSTLILNTRNMIRTISSKNSLQHEFFSNDSPSPGSSEENVRRTSRAPVCDNLNRQVRILQVFPFPIPAIAILCDFFPYFSSYSILALPLVI